MSSASPPPTAPRPGDTVQFDDDGSTRTGTVETVSWMPRYNHLGGLVLRVAVDGTIRRVSDGDLV